MGLGNSNFSNLQMQSVETHRNMHNPNHLAWHGNNEHNKKKKDKRHVQDHSQYHKYIIENFFQDRLSSILVFYFVYASASSSPQLTLNNIKQTVNTQVTTSREILCKETGCLEVKDYTNK